MVHASGGLVHPPSKQLKSEVAIVCGIAKATLLDDGSVLVVGGIGGNSSSGLGVLSSAEIYIPGVPSK